MNDLKKEINKLFGVWKKQSHPDQPDKGLPTKAFPNLWILLKSGDDIFVVEHMPKDYIESWIGNCKKNKHVQQVAYTVHYETFTQICFTCKKTRCSPRVAKHENKGVLKYLNVFLDGNALCITKPDFINLQESDAIFIELTPEQLEQIEDAQSSTAGKTEKEDDE